MRHQIRTGFPLGSSPMVKDMGTGQAVAEAVVEQLSTSALCKERPPYPAAYVCVYMSVGTGVWQLCSRASRLFRLALS